MASFEKGSILMLQLSNVDGGMNRVLIRPKNELHKSTVPNT